MFSADFVLMARVCKDGATPNVIRLRHLGVSRPSAGPTDHRPLRSDQCSTKYETAISGIESARPRSGGAFHVRWRAAGAGRGPT